MFRVNVCLLLHSPVGERHPLTVTTPHRHTHHTPSFFRESHGVKPMGTHMTQQRSSTFQNTEDTPEAARPNALLLHKSQCFRHTHCGLLRERPCGWISLLLPVGQGWAPRCLLPEVTASRVRLGSRGCPPVTSPACRKTLPTQVCGQAPALRLSVDRTGNAPQPRLPALPWKPSTCGRQEKGKAGFLSHRRWQLSTRLPLEQCPQTQRGSHSLASQPQSLGQRAPRSGTWLRAAGARGCGGTAWTPQKSVSSHELEISPQV